MADNNLSAKIALPVFLKMLSSNGVSASKAMAVASKIYKEYCTAEALRTLTDLRLKSAGVDDKDLRKLVLAAIRKAGYKSRAASSTASAPSPASAASSSAGSTNGQAVLPRKKRKRDDDRNEFLPDKPRDDGEGLASLEFNEVLDEKVLETKSIQTNRAPVMAAWAFVVAERLGFRREEALSIAHVYMQMNAVSRGVSEGIFARGKEKDQDAARDGAQPYVELMGRRIPLFQNKASQWRALSKEEGPVAPTVAFSYIKNKLRQTAPHVVGAMRLLANSYSPEELNRIGYSLYADFRPDSEEWGKAGQMQCAKVLQLRKAGVKESAVLEAAKNITPLVKHDPVVESIHEDDAPSLHCRDDQPVQKRARSHSAEHPIEQQEQAAGTAAPSLTSG